MPRYMSQFSYTADAWANLVKNPTDRSEAIGTLAKGLGAQLVGLYYTMGDNDGVVISEAPDDTTAIAIALAAITPGHVKSIKTTRLYTPDEIVAALKKAGTVAYSPP